MFEFYPNDLKKFEAADEQLKGLITAYQTGATDLKVFLSRLESIHRTMGEVLRKTEIGHSILARLENALEKISRGDVEFISRSPHSYHQVAWEAHRLLVETVRQGGTKYYNTLFIGWGRDIPAELKPMAKLFYGRFRSYGGEMVVLKTEGWKAYISAGGNPVHFTTVERRNDELLADISDFVPSRLDAVKEVLLQHGFEQTHLYIIERPITLKGGETDIYRNFLLGLRGHVSLLQTLVRVLFISTYLALSWTEDRGRESLVKRYIIEDYLRDPQPASKVKLFAEEIVFSDLSDILSKCSDDEVRRILGELLSMPREEVWRTVHEKYHFKWRISKRASGSSTIAGPKGLKVS
jgi:hypothetical protein